MLLYNCHNSDVSEIFRLILERNPDRGPGCAWLSSCNFPNRHHRLGFSNSEPDLAGYYLWLGVASGVYTQMLDVQNQTTMTLSDLEQGTEYFFAVSAYNTAGQASLLSKRNFGHRAPSQPDTDSNSQPDCNS